MARARPLPVMLVALILLGLCALPVSAWWSKGHMSVVLVAKRHMDASAVRKAELACKVLSLSGPYPQSPDMVQTAPWADDIKSLGLQTLSTWHYITTPYYTDENYTLAVSPVQTVNVASVIPMLQTAMETSTANSNVIVDSLALLLHFMGDIHQPLHNANIFSNEYPESDFGGNKQSVIIDSKGTKMSLHAYWDSMAEGAAGKDVPRPLSEDDYEDLNKFVDYLEATYANTLTEVEKNLLDPAEISKETYDLALKYAYPGAENGVTLSDEYKENAKKISERQVLLGGYRLAKMLNATLRPIRTEVILQGLKNIQDEVNKTNKSAVHNYYEESGLTVWVTALIAVALFIVGIISAALVVLIFHYYLQRRNNVCRYEPISF
ncbi:p1/s1 nuclease [Leishmania tarentolae]|uniref:P1/s1 nuclease n=1 Tax=Leishmania tarentolae TaxID=5689 RepID=A0A640KNF2_LEITA|nr:p1/s1 nuclease [Leishmania tarentolae]